jgi:hypothetical protein
MSINIHREKTDKILNIDDNDAGSPTISATISKNVPERRIDDEDELGLSYFANEDKEDPSNEELYENTSEEEVESTNQYNDKESDTDEYADYTRSFEEEQALRARYLVQLKRLHARGYVSNRRFGPEDSSASIKVEIMRLKKEKEIENGINYCKQGLVFFANTIEMLNRVIPGSPAKLDGWSTQIMRTQDDYDEVFEELYCKYASTIEMGPEIKLITMIAGSAFMFHINKLFAEQAMSGGNIQDILSKFASNKESSPKMKGPSKEAEELLKKLNTGDYDDISSTMSDSSEDDDYNKKPIPQAKKKRGRPSKK